MHMSTWLVARTLNVGIRDEWTRRFPETISILVKNDTDTRDWKESVYDQVVSDPRVQDTAWQIAESTHDGEGTLSVADIQAARRYLHACIIRMSVTELGNMKPHEFAGLWARGALGALDYRLRRRGGGASLAQRSRKDRTE
jgi:hypothetical protein